MNLPAFGLILMCCHAWALETNDYYPYARRNWFVDFLEKMKTVLKSGNESLGIPVLDPFVAENMPIKINEEMLTFDALLTNVNVQGLSDYDAIDGDFQFIDFSMNLSWPLIVMSTDYVMNGKLDSLEVYGSGEMNFSAHDFGFDTELGLILDDQHFKVRDMKLKLSLKALDFYATGLFDDDEVSEFLSAVITEIMPELLDDDIIMDRIKIFVISMINDFLSTKTLSEIMKILGY